MARLGNVTLTVVYSERPTHSVKSTDNPIEDGESIVDHTERQPVRLELSGVVTGGDAAASLRKLIQYEEDREMLSYVGRNSMSGVIIEAFSTDHNATNVGAFNFTMTLKEIGVADAATIKALKLPPAVKTQSAKVGNKGLQQTLTPAQLAAKNGNRVKNDTYKITTVKGGPTG